MAHFFWARPVGSLKPVWKPPVDADGLGEFSIRTTQDQSVVEFSAVLENINALVTAEKFEFLIIFDEFQEIKIIPRLEAKLQIFGAINCGHIVEAIDYYIELSRSIYSSLYAEFSLNERKIICALTSLHKTSSISGKEFLKLVDGVSKSGVANRVDKLMDKGTIDRSANEAGS